MSFHPSTVAFLSLLWYSTRRLSRQIWLFQALSTGIISFLHSCWWGFDIFLKCIGCRNSAWAPVQLLSFSIIPSLALFLIDSSQTPKEKHFGVLSLCWLCFFVSPVPALKRSLDTAGMEHCVPFLMIQGDLTDPIPSIAHTSVNTIKQSS